MLNHLISLIMCIHDPLCPLSFTSGKKKHSCRECNFRVSPGSKIMGQWQKSVRPKILLGTTQRGKMHLTLYDCSLKSINQANFKVKETNILYKVTGINVYCI